MTIHVNIGEAKTRLSELVAAAVRGEDVVLAKAGEPQVRLMPVADASDANNTARAILRQSAFGMYSHLTNGRDIAVRNLKLTEEEQEGSYRRKFGPAD